MEKDYTDMVNQAWQQLRQALAQRFTEEDMQLAESAFGLARQAHRLQRRKSGEPYILHPLAVARIVGVDLELDAHMVAAALLHDVVEDTPYTLSDIRERFGPDVASLVNVVTKRPKSSYDQSKQVDNFRQILESVHSDVRALLIKLADRLHNMRTLEAQRPDKQLKIATSSPSSRTSPSASASHATTTRSAAGCTSTCTRPAPASRPSPPTSTAPCASME